jgi:hypothetical protein
METGELLEMHSAGVFDGNINQNFNDALFFDSIAANYNLTEYEKSLIQQNGFMITERLTRSSFGEVFLEVYHKDLPVFISTDAILHAFHISYDRILRDMEVAVLINYLTSLLSQLHSAMPQLQSKYAAQPEMIQMLKDVDVYLTVPRKLLDENVTPYFPSNLEKVNFLYNRALLAQGMNSDTLFADACVVVDWSQFKPRGHYVDLQYPQLKNYFRAMMWLGRIEIYLLPPESFPEPFCVIQDFSDAVRQTIDSYLILELFDLSNSWQLYNDIEKILEFFVGKSDNVTLPDLLYLKNAIQLQDADELLDSLKTIVFQDSLKQQSFAYQLILSQILFQANATTPDSIVPASAFMLFGQRFVIDSYVTGSVVYDRIFYNGGKICRLSPSTLDPMFALGNNAAAQLLIPELDSYHYSSNLAALRYLIDSYDLDFWTGTIYNSWLNTIRKLNPPNERDNLPLFMQAAAFWQQKLNTQLSSWTQLRHDNLLYAKQSYTGGTICSYPYTYVEPFPDFYSSIKNYASDAYLEFQNLPFNEPLLEEEILNYYTTLVPIMDTLKTISEKILSGTPFTSSEVSFLKTVIYDMPSGSGSPPYGGWYSKLFYRDFEFGFDGLMKKDHIVADIHTTPTDCSGNFFGWITHVGTGSVNMGVFITELPGGIKAAFVGPFLSYYDYKTTNFLRLTDDEWDNQHLQAALRPQWVNIYLADSTGNSRGTGPSLLTSIEKDPLFEVPVSYLTAANYPNPFNPSTIISFTIPFDLENNLVELTVYNIQGEVIARLINNILPAGNYLTKWDGKNEKGVEVTSGIYIYQLNAGEKRFSGKMTLIR